MTTPEALYGPVSRPPAFTATPLQNCLNGCHAGAGDARSPVLCEPGQYICSNRKHSCLSKLDEWLRGLPDAFGLLLWVKAHGTVPGNPENARTKQPDAPAPMRLEVVDLLDQRPGFGVLGLLTPWTDLIRDERRLTHRCTCGHAKPSHAGKCSAAGCGCRAFKVTVAGECALLLGHLAWCAQHEWVKDLHDEIRILALTLNDTVGEYRPKPVGSCAALHDLEGSTVQVPCGGALVMDREGTGVHCLRCSLRYEANEGLRELGLIVGALFGEAS